MEPIEPILPYAPALAPVEAANIRVHAPPPTSREGDRGARAGSGRREEPEKDREGAQSRPSVPPQSGEEAETGEEPARTHIDLEA
ncbi:MAG TPA: hypothetical protein VKU89_06995 [Solirubrobacteraceae bacterium]|nr:hypothetical protein [Solirubrobacteraceae bacterium]